MERAGRDLTTTLPAPMTQLAPMSAIITVLLPIQQFVPITTCSNIPPCSWIGRSRSSKKCWCFPLKMSTLHPIVTWFSMIACPIVAPIANVNPLADRGLSMRDRRAKPQAAVDRESVRVMR